MLAIQNLLRNIGRFFKNTWKGAFQECAVFVSGLSVFLLVSLHAHGGEAVGKREEAAECSSLVRQEEGLAGAVQHGKEEGGKVVLDDGLAESVRKEQEGKLSEGGLKEQEIPPGLALKQEGERVAGKLGGMGGGFVSSCQQILEKGESAVQEAKMEQEQEEIVAASVNIQPMHNEMRQEPVNPYGDITMTDQDYEALLRIVEAEAGGEDPQGRTLVAEVILNRVLADQFASSVYDVVFERTGGSPQFATTADGRYYTVEVMPETVEAVEKAIHEEDLSQGALFFSARSKAEKNDMAWFDRNLKWLFQYGGHEFYTLP